MMQVANEQLNGNRTLCDTHEIATMLTQTPMPSPLMHMVDTVSAGDLHALVTTMIDRAINTVRPLPAGGSKTK